MLLQTTQLSPARCHQLREGGILQLMVNLLHEQTFEFHNQPEENINIESFLFNFNRKFKLRQRLSHEIRTIIGNTSVDAAELQVFDLLEAIRSYTETLYGFLTDIPKSKPEVIPPLNALGKLYRMTMPECVKSQFQGLKEENNDPATIVGYVEQFGGVYAILDLLRAHRRFVVRFHDQVIYSEINLPPPLTISEKSEAEYKDKNGFTRPKYGTSSTLPISKPVDVRYEHYRLVHNLFCNLEYLSCFWKSCSRKKEIRTFLANSRSFNQLLVDMLEDLDESVQGIDYFVYLCFVERLCALIYQLNRLPRRRNSYAIDCGVIKCLTKLAMNIEHSYAGIKTCVFAALSTLLNFTRDNVTEFFWIDGSVDMLIDVLTLPEEKQYKAQTWVLQILKQINSFFLKKNPNMPAERQLLALYKSRDIAAILLGNIQRFPSIASEFNIRNWLQQLKKILFCSNVLRRKFAKIEGAKEEIAKFHDSSDDVTSKAAKWISQRI